MAAVLNRTQAARSAAGCRSATSTTSSGIATMRDSVSRFGRSVSIARTLAVRRGLAGEGRRATCSGTVTQLRSWPACRSLLCGQRRTTPGDQHVRSHRRHASRATQPQHQAARGGRVIFIVLLGDRHRLHAERSARRHRCGPYPAGGDRRLRAAGHRAADRARVRVRQRLP